MDEAKKIYHVKEVMQILRLSRCSVTKLIESGQLKSIRAGGRILIPVWAVDEFINPPREKEQAEEEV